MSDDLDRYQRQSAYDLLGVPPGASAKEIRDRRNTLKYDLKEATMDASERAKQMQRIEEAYDQVSKAELRLKIDFFLLDPRVFLKQCETIAQDLTKPKTEVDGVIKPRRVRVSHSAILDDMQRFMREPGKVIGLHPRPMEIPEASPLPAPLAIQFDC
jgi:curved DNA-binding protein CbpA